MNDSIRTGVDYAERLAALLEATDEKVVIAAALRQRLRPGRLLCVGAGASDLASTLGVPPALYTAVEAGFHPDVAPSVQYDNVLLPSVLPALEDGYGPVLEAGWEHVRAGGRLMVVTYRDHPSAYTGLLSHVGQPRPRDDRRFNALCTWSNGHGQTEVAGLLSHVYGDTPGALADQLAIVATNDSDGDDATRAAVRRDLARLEAWLARVYADGSGRFAFPMEHVLIACDKPATWE